MKFWIPLLVLLLVPTIHAVETTLIAPYTCGTFNNETCFGDQAVVINGTSSTPAGLVFRQYSFENSNNRTNLYFRDPNNVLHLLATDFYSTNGILPLADFRKSITAYYDSLTNKIFYAYVIRNTDGSVASKAFINIKAYDVGAGSIASITTISAGCASAGLVVDEVRGVIFIPINSSNLIFISPFRSFCAGQGGDVRGQYFGREIAMTTSTILRSFDTALGTVTGATGTYVSSGVFNGTHIRIGAEAKYRDITYATGTYGPFVSMATGSVSPYGALFADFTNTSQFFYSDNRDGNYELYYGRLPTQTTRRTISSKNEVLYDGFSAIDQTQIISYWVSAENRTYYDYYCPLLQNNGTLGVSCAGVSNGGLVSCNYGYGLDENGACVLLPGFQNTNPNVQLAIYDRACAENRGFNPDIRDNGQIVVFDDCPIDSNPFNPIEVFDYVYVVYKINNQFAAPTNYNSSNFPPSFSVLAANASCQACLSSNSSDCFTLGINNFSATYGLEPNVPYYSFEARSSSLHWAGKQIQVTCNSGIANTLITNQFVVANTIRYTVSDTLDAGPLGRLNGFSNLNESPITAQKQIKTATYGSVPSYLINMPYGDAGTAVCRYLMDSSSVTIANTFMTHSKWSLDANIATTTLQVPTIGMQNRPSGNYRMLSQCYTNTDPTNTYKSRSPSLAYSKNYIVNDQCSGTNQTLRTTLNVQLKHRNGNVSSSYVSGENIYVDANYLFGGNPYDKGQCSLTLSNATSGQILDSFTVLNHVQGGPYSATVYADPNEPDPYDSNYIASNSQNTILQNGTYRLNVTCINLDTSVCLIPSTSSKTFNFTTDGCAGTSSACTIDSCSACGNSQVICEDGFSRNVQDACISRECSSPLSTSQGVCGEHNNYYSISVVGSPNSVQCGSDKLTARISLLRRGVQIPSLALSDLACTLTVAPVIANGQAYDIGKAVILNVPQTTQASMEVSLIGKINQFKDSYCGETFILLADCYSANFSISKHSESRFFIGSLGNDCSVKDQLVSEGQCVSQVTGKDSDKGLRCIGGAIVTAGDPVTGCDCPAGQSFNATSNQCQGRLGFASGYLSWAIDFLSFRWIAGPGGILLILFLWFIYPYVMGTIRTLRGERHYHYHEGKD